MGLLIVGILVFSFYLIWKDGKFNNSPQNQGNRTSTSNSVGTNSSVYLNRMRSISTTFNNNLNEYNRLYVDVNGAKSYMETFRGTSSTRRSNDSLAYWMEKCRNDFVNNCLGLWRDDMLQVRADVIKLGAGSDAAEWLKNIDNEIMFMNSNIDKLKSVDLTSFYLELAKK